MKYGSELARRSVPEWSIHNIDYNDIKELIRRSTTKGSREQLKATQELLALLNEELDRVNLFVKSKVGEIERRLSDCERIVQSIERRTERSERGPTGLLDTQDEAELQERLYNLHRRVTALTKDVQSLSRYIGAQRTGFRKLLKKYRKWSSSDFLSSAFLPLLESHSAFTHVDLSSTFSRVSILYDVLRGTTPQVSSPDRSFIEIAAPSPTAFDCDMITNACTTSTSSRFWVHPDNIMEVKVTLLKELNLLNQNDENASVLYLDNVKKLHHRIDTGSEPGQVRWSGPADPTVAESGNQYVLCSPVNEFRNFVITPVSDTQYEAIVQKKWPVPDESISANGRLALRWVHSRQATPISLLSSMRTRFTYAADAAHHLASARTSALDLNPRLWAALDRDVVFYKIDDQGSTTDRINFPYAVLDIRWKDMDKPAWVLDLERSHLLWPTPTFSLFLHSVGLYIPEAFESQPPWFQLLQQGVDIRRSSPDVPKTPTLSRASSSAWLQTSQNQTSLTTDGQPSILLNQPPSRHKSQLLDLAQSKPKVRYWNEFDDDEDNEYGGGDIFLDYDDTDEDGSSSGILNSRQIDSIVGFSDKVVRGINKVRYYFVTDGNETSALLSDDGDSSVDNDLSGRYSPRPSHRRARRYTNYDTFDKDSDLAVQSRRNHMLTFMYSISLFLSALMTCVMLGVIAGEDINVVNYGTIVFIVIVLLFALAIAILGMCLFTLRETPPWWHQTLVMSVFFSIVCFCIGGVAWLLSLTA